MSNANHIEADEIRRMATGQWVGILSTLAPELGPALHRVGRHVPCPVHGGEDGFRLFPDAEEKGGGVCNTCGARPDGFALLQWLRGWSFPEVLEQVHSVLGGVTPRVEEPRKRYEVADNQPRSMAVNDTVRDALRRRWTEAKRLDRDPEARAFVTKYLRNRGLDPERVMPLLEQQARLHPGMTLWREAGVSLGQWPALLTLARDADGRAVTFHRTYLGQYESDRPTGGQVGLDAPTKKLYPLMEGASLKGGAIRLGEPQGGVLGIAEGIETALSVHQATGMTVWSTISASLMRTFQPPEGVSEVVVWADADANGAGQEAARALKKRLWSEGVRVAIRLPDQDIEEGDSMDWNDVFRLHGEDGMFRFRSA